MDFRPLLQIRIALISIIYTLSHASGVKELHESNVFMTDSAVTQEQLTSCCGKHSTQEKLYPNTKSRGKVRSPYANGDTRLVRNSPKTISDFEALNELGHFEHQHIPKVTSSRKEFIYGHRPTVNAYEFGFNRGDSEHAVERYEKAGGNHDFKTKVKWEDAGGGYGQQVWDYNHVPKIGRMLKHHSTLMHASSEKSPTVEVVIPKVSVSGNNNKTSVRFSAPKPTNQEMENQRNNIILNSPPEYLRWRHLQAKNTNRIKTVNNVIRPELQAFDVKRIPPEQLYSRKRHSKQRKENKSGKHKYQSFLIPKVVSYLKQDDETNSYALKRIKPPVKKHRRKFRYVLKSKNEAHRRNSPSQFPNHLTPTSYPTKQEIKRRHHSSKIFPIPQKINVKRRVENTSIHPPKKRIRLRNPTTQPKLAYDLNSGRILDLASRRWFKLVPDSEY